MGSLTIQHKCTTAAVILQPHPLRPYSQNSNYSTNSSYSEHSNSSYPYQGDDNFVRNTTHQQTQSNTIEKSTAAQYITHFINNLEN